MTPRPKPQRSYACPTPELEQREIIAKLSATIPKGTRCRLYCPEDENIHGLEVGNGQRIRNAPGR